MKKTRVFTVLATILLALTLATCLYGCSMFENLGKKTSTVTLDSNGGTPLTQVEYQGEVGTDIYDLPSPEKEGFTFDGWYDSEGNKVTSFVYPESDAKWKAKYTADSDMEIEFSTETELNYEYDGSTYWTEDDFKNEDKPYIRFLSKSELPFNITIEFEERISAAPAFSGIATGTVTIIGANVGDTLYSNEFKNTGSFVEQKIEEEWVGTKLYGGSDGRYIQMRLSRGAWAQEIIVRNIKITFKYTLPAGSLI